LPYELITYFTAQDNPMVLSSTITSFNSGIKQAIVSQIDNETYLTLKNVIMILTFIGFIWFIKDAVSLKIKLQGLSHETSHYNTINSIKIYKTNNDEIFTVGITKPKIYIGEKYLNSSFTDSIIKHELQHIQSNDQIWLLLITFVQRLLWWNPIVYLLALKARELIELSCDQACKEQSIDNQYQEDLAQILIFSNNKSNPIAIHFFGKSKLNIYRIKQLSKEFTMNKKHKALIFSTALIPFVLLLFVSTSSVSSNLKEIDSKEKPVVLAKNEVDITLNVILTIPRENDVDTQKIEAHLINKFNEPMMLRYDEKMFEVEFTPKKINDNEIFLETDITYEIDGEKYKQQPSLMISNNNEASLLIQGENHTLEIIVLTRF
jgi:beta-lactamase regulating signal transducer with metallopeptidase domain